MLGLGRGGCLAWEAGLDWTACWQRWVGIGVRSGQVPVLPCHLFPQVSSFLQTLQAPDWLFLQPWHWLDTWVRQVWGCWHENPSLGRGWQQPRPGLSHDTGATVADARCLSLQVGSSRQVSAGIAPVPCTACLTPGTLG